MRTTLIAAMLAGGCLIGYGTAAMAQSTSTGEHPSVATPGTAKQNPNAAAESTDRQMAPSSSSDTTGKPAPGPHESGH